MLLPKVISLGEFHNIKEDFKNNDKCSCGEHVSSCFFWKAPFQKFQQGVVEEKDLFDQLHFDQPNTIFIDASKTTFSNFQRPFKLAEAYDVLFIHLVRDGFSVLGSNLKRKPRNLFWNSMVTAIHWKLANYFSERFKLKYRDRYLLVKYEELIHDPTTLLKKVAKALDLKISDELNGFCMLPLGHQISGNNIRFEKELKVEKRISNTDELPRVGKWVFSFFSGSMVKRYYPSGNS